LKAFARLGARLGIVTIAIVVVLVPAIARAHQRVERRDATRLSIKHSWIGVAPPSKAVVSPQRVVLAPAIAVEPELEPRPRLNGAVLAPPVALHPVLDLSPDSLRGPPASPSLA